MSRRPNASQALALKAAAAAAREADQDEDEAVAAPEHAPVADPAPQAETALSSTTDEAQSAGARPIGRPKGRRPVAARQTVYLDDARHAALARIAEDRGRSIHSLILEGIDHVIGKPTAKGWQ